MTFANLKLVFFHIPKTGGATLQGIINRNYAKTQRLDLQPRFEDQLAGMQKDQLATVKIIKGHFDFRIHEILDGDPQYFTLLRDPVERTISNYYFIKGRPQNRLYKAANEEFEGMRSFLESGVLLSADNCQVRIISGNSRVPFGSVNNTMLEQAKENIEQHFSVVGITERFDESLLLMQELGGWKYPYYARKNETKERLEKDEVSPTDMAKVNELNEYDWQLYDWCKNRFEQMVTEKGVELKRRLQKFQRKNPYFATASKLKNRFFPKDV